MGRLLTETLPDPDGVGPLAAPVMTYTYAADGRLQSVEDFAGQLLSYVDNAAGLINQYQYDYLDCVTRITQAGQPGGNTVAEKRVDLEYDLEFKIRFAEITRYADLAGSETVEVSSYAYDFAGRLTGIDHRDTASVLLAGYSLSYDEGNRLTKTGIATGETAEYSWDHRNRLTAIVTKDDLGVITHEVQYTYDIFDRRIVSETDPAFEFLYGFTGRERDTESDLQYNRARYYEAVLGRWLSQDPIGFEAGDANLYRYVGNSATTKTDPSGLEEVTLDVNTFIPAEWVTRMPGIWLTGDDRGPGQNPDGSFRIKSQIAFDTDAIGNALVEQNPGIGQSKIMFGCLLPGIGGGFVSTEFTGTGSSNPKQTATGANGKVELHISNGGNVPRKFVVTAAAPLIDYSFTGHAREEGDIIYIDLKYQRDGFPAYEVFANQQPVYCHNPEDTSQTPLSLFGGGEFSRTLWMEIDKGTGKVRYHGTGPRVIVLQAAPPREYELLPIKIAP